MTSARTAQSERPVYECDCRQKWGSCVRCAHFDGDAVQLDDYTEKMTEVGGPRYRVWRIQAREMYLDGESDDYDAALAAFHEAEARLLAGGAE